MHDSRCPRVYQTQTAANKAYKLLLKLQKLQIQIKIQPDKISYKPVSHKKKSYQESTQAALWLAAFFTLLTKGQTQKRWKARAQRQFGRQVEAWKEYISKGRRNGEEKGAETNEQLLSRAQMWIN